MARRRFQNPRPKKHGNWWTILVRKDVFTEGRMLRIRERVRLLPADRGERDAQRKAAEYLRPMNQGLTPVASAYTLQEFVDTLYLPTMKQGLLRSTSYDRAAGIFRNYLLPKFGRLCLHELSTLTLQTYFASLDACALSFESRDKIRDVLSSALGFAKQHGLTTVNPCESVRVPQKHGARAKAKKYFLTPEQFGQLIEFIPEPYATMVYVSIFTGLRVSELIGLRWDDIHEHSITVDERYCRGDWDEPKSEASKATIPVNPGVIDRINRLKDLTVEVRAGRAIRKYKVVKENFPESLVFQSVKDGRPMRDNNILCRFIKPAARALGMPWVNWLAMRRSHDNWLRMAGADLKDRQAQMRHAHPKVTAEVYDQFIPENQRAAVDRLSSLRFGSNGSKAEVSDLAQLIENMVARDGVEPPTPAFSGLESAERKRLIRLRFTA